MVVFRSQTGKRWQFAVESHREPIENLPLFGKLFFIGRREEAEFWAGNLSGWRDRQRSQGVLEAGVVLGVWAGVLVHTPKVASATWLWTHSKLPQLQSLSPVKQKRCLVGVALLAWNRVLTNAGSLHSVCASALPLPQTLVLRTLSPALSLELAPSKSAAVSHKTWSDSCHIWLLPPGSVSLNFHTVSILSASSSWVCLWYSYFEISWESHLCQFFLLLPLFPTPSFPQSLHFFLSLFCFW